MKAPVSLLLFLFFAFFCISSYAQNATVISENANLRGTPKQDGKVVDVLPVGTQMHVIKQAGAWFLVQTENFAGWVHGNTIKLLTSAQIDKITIEKPSSSSVPDLLPTTTNVSPDTTVTVDSDSPSSENLTASARCADGTISYSQNRSGTCSHHGGVAEWLNSATQPTYQPGDNSTSPKTVNVKGYTRKDGTVVKPYTRSAPHPH